jgi:hypothetical protein
MIDYEVVKTDSGYAMQVNRKFYIVPENMRHLHRNKLMQQFTKVNFVLLNKPVLPGYQPPTLK